MRCALVMIVGLALTASGPAAANAQQSGVGATVYSVDQAHSALEFVVRFMGLSKVRGRFTDFSGTLMFAPDHPEHSTVALVVNVQSINTDDDFRDRHLRSPDWFGAEQYPRITFQSRRLERDDETHFTVFGPLTIHGVTHEVGIPVELIHGDMRDAWGNRRIGFEGSLTINRKDFGVEGTNFFNRAFDVARMGVSNEVRIEFTISARIFNMDRIAYSAPPGRRPVGARVEEVLRDDGIEMAVRRYRELRADSGEGWAFSPGQLNTLGYKLLQHGRITEAIAMFELNAAEYPDNPNTHDSLGEAYAAGERPTEAIRAYERALRLDPYLTGAIEMLRWLQGRTHEITLTLPASTGGDGGG